MLSAISARVHVYEVPARKDKRGVDLISDVLPFGRLWYTKPDDAIGYAQHRSRSHSAVIRVYDDAGNVIETHKHKAISGQNDTQNLFRREDAELLQEIRGASPLGEPLILRAEFSSDSSRW